MQTLNGISNNSNIHCYLGFHKDEGNRELSVNLKSSKCIKTMYSKCIPRACSTGVFTNEH